MQNQGQIKRQYKHRKQGPFMTTEIIGIEHTIMGTLIVETNTTHIKETDTQRAIM